MSCMHNYRAAAGLYLLLLNAKVKLFPALARGKKTEDFQCVIALLHY